MYVKLFYIASYYMFYYMIYFFFVNYLFSLRHIQKHFLKFGVSREFSASICSIIHFSSFNYLQYTIIVGLDIFRLSLIDEIHRQRRERTQKKRMYSINIFVDQFCVKIVNDHKHYRILSFMSIANLIQVRINVSMSIIRVMFILIPVLSKVYTHVLVVSH